MGMFSIIRGVRSRFFVPNLSMPNYLLWASWYLQMPRTAPPPKIPNLEKRSREHLFPQEVAAMISAAKKVGRHGLRDSTLILMA